jgi:vacuolar-type H+-ATPase catalytic subunit A/Vma1
MLSPWTCQPSSPTSIQEQDTLPEQWATGSITFIGTVSPAGGNLKEPVTESTKKAARCFYALSQQRADSKRYPPSTPSKAIQNTWNTLKFRNTSKKPTENWVKMYVCQRLLFSEARKCMSRSISLVTMVCPGLSPLLTGKVK